MKIKHYLCNAFVIESDNTKIIIDPGLDTWIFNFKNYIPKSEWIDATHILIAHGDIDHYWSPEQIAEVSGASLIYGKELIKQIGNENFILDPRNREIGYSTRMETVYPLEVGEVLQIDDLVVEAFKAAHSPLKFKFFFGVLNKIIARGRPR